MANISRPVADELTRILDEINNKSRRSQRRARRFATNRRDQTTQQPRTQIIQYSIPVEAVVLKSREQQTTTGKLGADVRPGALQQPSLVTGCIEKDNCDADTKLAEDEEHIVTGLVKQDQPGETIRRYQHNIDGRHQQMSLVHGGVEVPVSGHQTTTDVVVSGIRTILAWTWYITKTPIWVLVCTSGVVICVFVVLLCIWRVIVYAGGNLIHDILGPVLAVVRAGYPMVGEWRHWGVCDVKLLGTAIATTGLWCTQRTTPSAGVALVSASARPEIVYPPSLHPLSSDEVFLVTQAWLEEIGIRTLYTDLEGREHVAQQHYQVADDLGLAAACLARYTNDVSQEMKLLRRVVISYDHALAQAANQVFPIRWLLKYRLRAILVEYLASVDPRLDQLGASGAICEHKMGLVLTGVRELSNMQQSLAQIIDTRLNSWWALNPFLSWTSRQKHLRDEYVVINNYRYHEAANNTRFLSFKIAQTRLSINNVRKAFKLDGIDPFDESGQQATIRSYAASVLRNVKNIKHNHNIRELDMEGLDWDTGFDSEKRPNIMVFKQDPVN